MINRLKRESDFNKVFSKGKRVYLKTLAMLYIKSDQLKIGYSVSKKHGHAVVRNRIKRLLRAATREVFKDYETPLYIVFMPKKRDEYSYNEFLSDIRSAYKQLPSVKCCTK